MRSTFSQIIITYAKMGQMDLAPERYLNDEEGRDRWERGGGRGFE
jgi:hypothetical protein